MRLIDKESFKDNILNKQMYLIQTQDGVFCYYVAVLDAIEFEPEVKAIPIVWIENYIADRSSMSGVNWSYVKDMLEDWEKENEAN